MELKEFAQAVKKEIEQRLGAFNRVKLTDVRKNNGVVLTGIAICQGVLNMTPNIYLNDYYTEYIKGALTFDAIVTSVLAAHYKNLPKQRLDAQHFFEFDDVKGNIVYKLINRDMNEALLEEIPYIEFLDLAIVFECLLDLDQYCKGSMLIHNGHLKLWHVTKEAVYEAAKENTEQILPYEIKGVSDILCEIMGKHPEQINEDEKKTELADCAVMYMLSNNMRVGGAACMLYPNLTRDFAERVGSNFYIIPSSIHECLLLPAENTNESVEIKNIIKEVNDTQVDVEERLSYSLYFYDKEADNIRIL